MKCFAYLLLSILGLSLYSQVYAQASERDIIYNFLLSNHSNWADLKKALSVDAQKKVLYELEGWTSKYRVKASSFYRSRPDMMKVYLHTSLGCSSLILSALSFGIAFFDIYEYERQQGIVKEWIYENRYRKPLLGLASFFMAVTAVFFSKAYEGYRCEIARFHLRKLEALQDYLKSVR